MSQPRHDAGAARPLGAAPGDDAAAGVEPGPQESWQDEFDVAEEEPEYEDPPSSSALLFAKLAKPRVTDRPDEPRRARSGPGSRPTAPPPPTQDVTTQQGADSGGGASTAPPAPSPTGQNGAGAAPPAAAAGAGGGGREPSHAPDVTRDATLQALERLRAAVQAPMGSAPREAAARAQNARPAHILIDAGSDSGDDPNADLSLEDAEPDRAGKSSARDGEAGEPAGLGDDGAVETSRLQEVAYVIADSRPSFAAIIFLLAVDQAFFLVGLLYLLTGTTPAAYAACHVVVDCVTGVVFFVEVNLRLFSYGPRYYFHSLIRRLDYSVCVLNAAMVLSSVVFARRMGWLLVVRYIRLIRTLTVIVMWRERRIKTQAMQELEELAVLLANERSEQNRLVKWRIDSDTIAMGEAAGQGGFGAVFLGLFRGTLVAVKQLYQNNRKAAEYTSIEDEAVTLVNLRHPNVVLFMGFVHEPDKLWIVTEYCSRGSLRDLLDSSTLCLTQSRILKFALGAARGLAYLHGQDPPVLHLDLKTSNILVSSGWDCKLADFGLSRNIDNIQNNTFAGTIQYSAPEILESNSFSVAADVYSFGICLWEMAARDVPYEGTPPMEVLWGVVKEGLRPPADAIRAKLAGASPFPGPVPAAPPRAGQAGVLEGSLQADAQLRTTARIDAAMVVASGSVQRAAATRERLSAPSLDVAVLVPVERTPELESRGHVGCAPREEGVPFDDVLSPVSAAGLGSPPGPRTAVEDIPILPSFPAACDRAGGGPAGSRSKMPTMPLRQMSNRSATSHMSSNSSVHSGKSDQSQRSDEAPEERRRRAKKRGRRSILRGGGGGGGSSSRFDDDKDEAARDVSVPSDRDRSAGGPPAQTAAPAPVGLDVLTSRVTAKIMLFDDRPDVAKRQAPSAAAAAAPLPPANLSLKVIDAFRSKRGQSADEPAVMDSLSRNVSYGDRGGDRNGGSPTYMRHRSGSSLWGDDGDRSGGDRPPPPAAAGRRDTFQARLQSFSVLGPAPPRVPSPPTAGHAEAAGKEVEAGSRSELAAGPGGAPAPPTGGAIEMSDDYVDLIRRCWAQNPAERPTADEIVWRLVAIIDGQIRATSPAPTTPFA